MRPFSLLIKPASASCNLACDYCFYRNPAPYGETGQNRMADAVLERMIETYLATEQPSHVFIWQGGEPTLMGEEFFRRVIELQLKHCREGAVIANGLQTNATLLTDNLCRLLRAYSFLVGCSLDGPAHIHDRYRRTLSGSPSHARVLNGIDRLRRYKVEFNILTLVSRANVRRAREVYSYFRDQGFCFQQYIPCTEFDRYGRLQPYAINGEEWGDFLCELFAEWHPRDIHRVSIRHFDTILAKMVDGTADTCTIGNDCRQYCVVEWNGDIYPCDFFVKPEYRLGNIMEKGWSGILRSDSFADFGRQKSKWPQACDQCEFLEYCAGDCIKNRVHGVDGQDNPSCLCRGWRKLYRQHLGDLKMLASSIRCQRL
jgi:uncharacterized protein